MLKDFRDFIYRDNVIDLAIGVIMGASFTAIINSPVGDMFMSLIGARLGGESILRVWLSRWEIKPQIIECSSKL